MGLFNLTKKTRGSQVGDKIINEQIDVQRPNDPHLNLFYSYAPGSLSKENFERAKQLEDNHTRAFIITLMLLDTDSQKQFLNHLLPKEVKSKQFNYDLQTTSLYSKSKEIPKYVIVLQRDDSNISLDDIQNLDHEILVELESDENKSLIKNINACIKDECDFEIGEIVIPLGQLYSIIQLLSGNRPDAWIIGDKEACLIESKIGNNSVSPYQIYRHITGHSGLNITSKNLKANNENLTIINVTWEEIANYFREVDKNNFIVEQFLKYITMTGQTLNFDYIIDNKLDSEVHKEQMNLFLNKIDKELIERNLRFERKGRGKGKRSGLWEPYGIKNDKGEIGNNPHFSIYFDKNSLSVRLTTRVKKQVNEELFNEIKEYYTSKVTNETGLFRYEIRMGTDLLIDPKRKARSGDRHDTFKFEIRFTELSKNFKKIEESILSLVKIGLCKQFEIGFVIDFLDFNKIRDKDKEKQIRYKNKKLLSNPLSAIKSFVDFMEETMPMFELMKAGSVRVNKTKTEKTSQKTVELAENIFKKLGEVTAGFKLKYNNNYIGIRPEYSNRATNFIAFGPKKDIVKMDFIVAQSAELDKLVEKSGMGQNPYYSDERYRLDIAQDDLNLNFKVIQTLSEKAKLQRFSK